MNNTHWLVFSFSLPARSQGIRVKIWRRLNALGAVQAKNALYLLPASDAHQEQLVWLAKETEEQGGEAVIVRSDNVLTMSREQIRALFAKARDADYAALEVELVALVQEGGDPVERGASLRRLAKRLEAVRRIDFFPSGKGASLARHLEQALAPEEQDMPEVPLVDASAYLGKVWVTRKRPYVDRLASFWLVRRFIDPYAHVAFCDGDQCPQAPGQVRFDMAQAEFTHVGGLITFEVLARSFAVLARLPERLVRVLRAIDLEEMDAAPAEAAGVKRVLDGLLLRHADDQELTARAMDVFDALLATYQAENTGE